MISFNVCNKPFKPLGIPSGQVKSREGLTEVVPTNTLSDFFFKLHLQNSRESQNQYIHK